MDLQITAACRQFLLVSTHRVVKVFNSELSKALVHKVQFALCCHCFKPKRAMFI